MSEPEYNPWRWCRRTGHSELRPYVPGEDLSHVSVSATDTPSPGGFIARNPKDYADQWYINAPYVAENLELFAGDCPHMDQVPKTIDVLDVMDTRQKVSDVVITGDPDCFALLCKASSQSQGWMKSTKVCNVAHGCVVQVTTQQRNPDGSYVVAEAVTYVPYVWIDVEAHPRRFMDIAHFHPDYVATALETGHTHG